VLALATILVSAIVARAGAIQPQEFDNVQVRWCEIYGTFREQAS
jgi:hypothetical protein